VNLFEGFESLSVYHHAEVFLMFLIQSGFKGAKDV